MDCEVSVGIALIGFCVRSIRAKGASFINSCLCLAWTEKLARGLASFMDLACSIHA